jgi:hypothetical protein
MIKVFIKIFLKSWPLTSNRFQVSGFKKRRIGWEAIRLGSWKALKLGGYQAWKL